MKTQTTPKTVKRNISQTSILNKSRSSVASNLLRKQETLKRQMEELKCAQRTLDADIKLVNTVSHQIAVRDYDIKRIEQKIRDTEEMMTLSQNRQLQFTNIQKHSDEVKRMSTMMSSLPSSSSLSLSDFQMRSQLGENEYSTGKSNDDVKNDDEMDEYNMFEIPPNHQKAEEIIRLEKYVEGLRSGIIKHEKEVVNLEQMARAKQVKNSVHMKLNLSSDKKRITAEQKHQAIIEKYKNDIEMFKVLKEARDEENNKLEEQKNIKADLDLKELDIKLQEMLFEKSNKGSIEYANSEEKTFDMPEIEETDNSEFIAQLEKRAFEEEEKLTEEETLLEKQIQEAKQELEIAKINAKANEEHVQEVLQGLEEEVAKTNFENEKVQDKENELDEKKSENEKQGEAIEETIEKLTNKKADLLEEINDACNERMETLNGEGASLEKETQRKLDLDKLDFDIAALSVQRENILTLIKMQQIREKADNELLETLKAEYVEEGDN